ncbi:MAG: GyrI-like domain-containing protein [Dysgonomonas sp.]|nr:GyrI-like domain-containing protein [Dysgonomonas sp.]
MKILKIVLVIIAILAIACTAVYAFYGGFSTIEIRTEKTGGDIFVYESVTGDYSQTSLYTDKIYHSLLEDSIHTTRGAGIFYDNPKHVEISKLRSEVGCLLDNEPDSLQMITISEKHKIKTIPEGNYITAQIPFKGPLSVVIGILKAYPAINKYMEENNLPLDKSPVIEIYDMSNKKIVYLKQIIE